MLTRHRQKLLIAIGFLLFIAAAMKVFGRNADPFARIGVFSLQSAQFLVIVFEILLAIWLWSRAYTALSWTASVITFAAFATISAYQAWIGESSCGCLGRFVKVHPLVTLTFDLTLIGSLILVRPELSSLRAELASLRGIPFKKTISAAAVACSILGGLAVFGIVRYGSVASAMAALKREPVTVEPFLIDVGQCNFGERKNLTIRVCNHTANPVRIVGQLPDCTCMTETDFPLVIPPGDSVEVKIQFAALGNEGLFTQEEGLFLDVGHLEVLHYRVTGQIVDNSK